MAKIARDNGMERNTCPDLRQDTEEMLAAVTMGEQVGRTAPIIKTGWRS